MQSWNNIFEFTAFIFKTIKLNDYSPLISSFEIIIRKARNALRSLQIIIIIFEWGWNFVKTSQNFRVRNENVVNAYTSMNMPRRWIKSMKSFKFRWFELKLDKKNMLIIIGNTFLNVRLKTKFDSILEICASNVSSRSYSTRTKIFSRLLLWSIRMFIV